jgi:hypothetical protein
MPINFTSRMTDCKYRTRCEELGVTATDMVLMATTSARLD